eukprot:7648519-Prorocentrum_lima.AAC.1
MTEGDVSVLKECKFAHASTKRMSGSGVVIGRYATTEDHEGRRTILIGSHVSLQGNGQSWTPGSDTQRH